MMQACADTGVQLVDGEVLGLEVALHELFAGRRHGLDQSRRYSAALSAYSSGNLDDVPGRAQVLVVVHQRVHLDQVDDAGEVGLDADRKLENGEFGVSRSLIVSTTK